MKFFVLKFEYFGMEKREFIFFVFRLGEVVKVEVVFLGRIEGEMIVKVRNRFIEVINIRVEVGDRIRVRIVRIRYGIYIGIFV